MCFNTIALLPQCLRADFICSTFHGAEFSDNFPDVTTFHSNGYIYEIKNKKIIASLNLKEEEVINLSVYYLPEHSIYVRYYLAFSNGNKLLIVKKDETDFQIIQSYSNVQQFRVFDFKALGYPQIEISFLGTLETKIIEFSDCLRIDTTNIIFDNNVWASCMEEKLQVVKCHINELMNENLQTKKIILNQRTKVCDHLVLPCNPLKLSIRQDKNVSPKLIVTNIWHKNFGKFWIYGLRLTNKSERILTDVQLTLSQKQLEGFTYCFFELSNVKIWPTRTQSSISPGQDLLVVGAFRMPSMMTEPTISIDCFLTCSEYRNNMKIDTLTLRAVDILRRFNREINSVDEILAMQTIHDEVNLRVETEANADANDLPEATLLRLGFSTFEYQDTKFFYHPSLEMGLVIDQISKYPHVWQLTVYVSDFSWLHLLINALYDELPEKTNVTYR